MKYESEHQRAELTDIHERLFSYCATHLNSLFYIQSSYPFYECLSTN